MINKIYQKYQNIQLCKYIKEAYHDYIKKLKGAHFEKRD